MLHRAPHSANYSTEVTGTALSNVNYDSAAARIINWAKANEHRYVCVCNVHSTTTAHWDPSLRRALDESDMNTADGMPLVWMQRRLGHTDATRVYGPTLMLHTLEQASREKLRVAFYGGHPDRMPTLLKMVREQYPHIEIVATITPPFRPLTASEDDAYTAELIAAKPQITWVGIGCPKQEIWMNAHAHRIPGVMIGVGAAFDFHANAVEQAPERLQKLGLEWAFRLSREPKRLLRRYLTTNPVFLFKAAKQLLQAKYQKRRFKSLNKNETPQTSEPLNNGKRIAICIASYQRPFLLNDLLKSINACKRPEGIQLELRIIDNDVAESARAVVEDFRQTSNQFEAIHYAVESRQNIAHARNSAIAMGPADAYVFVDDDETVHSNWLIELIRCANNHQADAVFGPVRAKLGELSGGWQEHGRFFEKAVAPTGTSINWQETRTSNTLVRGKWFNDMNFRFDSELGRSGGSDSDLFARMSSKGANFISCREAVVEEYVPANRATLAWLWKRAYRNGLIYERNIRRVTQINHPIARACKRLAAAALLCLRSTPALLKAQPAACIRGLLKLPLMLGGLHATLIPSSTTRHIAYKGNTESGTKRVAFLTNIVSPYRKPVFQALADTPGIELRVFVDAQSEFDRNWKVELSDLPLEQTHCFSWKQQEQTKGPISFQQTLTKHMPYGLPYQLKRFNPEVVISLELGLRTALAALYCKVTGTELVIWCYQSRVSASQSWLRKTWRKALLAQASSVVGMGTQAREVLLAWGVPPEKIIDAPNASDQSKFLQTLNQDKAERHIEAIREVYAPEQKMALIVGRLIPLKGIEHILEQWNALPETIKEQWKLVFVGSGPLDTLIEQQDSRFIELAGNVPTTSMPYWYAAADLHIFPTCGDVWGLVVNEASICGTPTLCSEHAGCFDDLIRDGETGFQINFAASDDAPNKLQAVLQHEDLPSVGRAAQSAISSYTPQNMAHSFQQAIVSANIS
ncbi:MULTISPECIES: WecB/TagA/CpsF family glycosyltransferase [unclassified Lentimonas]|uniref:WecB/TagA/CpsF family glycosyltransferase n=1 Tax=unclassified Lentimonas TaxID=2630993 RepID=UPI001324F682|nr:MULTISPECIES: WecB/TagA/CpsF family glycosyltransferase [unclassified Lentimonas]CAA6690758.1 Unannotated [Lentimonas sp. CC19]CAA6693316.1 Unannotated [Lentimonas sp. CC10]CAA7071796.1 Unannotated [Lentimonas sp. CC11]